MYVCMYIYRDVRCEFIELYVCVRACACACLHVVAPSALHYTTLHYKCTVTLYVAVTVVSMPFLRDRLLYCIIWLWCLCACVWGCVCVCVSVSRLFYISENQILRGGVSVTIRVCVCVCVSDTYRGLQAFKPGVCMYVYTKMCFLSWFFSNFIDNITSILQ